MAHVCSLAHLSAGHLLTPPSAQIQYLVRPQGAGNIDGFVGHTGSNPQAHTTSTVCARTFLRVAVEAEGARDVEHVLGARQRGVERRRRLQQRPNLLRGRWVGV